MSVETKHYCDRCKKETQKESIITVQIKLAPYSSYTVTTYKHFDSISSYQEYCIECIEKLGFVKKVGLEEGKVVVEPTTADKLYDIVVQIVNENTG